MNWYKKIILAGLPTYSFKELVKKLTNEYGLKFIRHGKGDDQVWGIPGSNRQTVIPFSGKARGINPLTLANILRHLQIPLSEFKKKQYKQKVAPESISVQQPEKIPEWQKSRWYQEQQQELVAN